jgi:L-iditol 2-dehydrogenase
VQGILVREIGRFELTGLPVPTPGPGEALIEVAVTGLCRTDLKLIEAGHRDLVLPRVPGEEVVGVVRALGPTAGVGEAAAAPIAAGDAAAAGPITPGDRVYVYPGVSCGACPPCRRDAGNLCRQMSIMGFHRDGGFADYVAAPLRSLIRLPEGLSDQEAVFAEPLSCCLNALELGRVAEGGSLGVWGAGPAGTLLARAGRLRGARVHVVEPDARRRARAAAEGGVEVSDTPPSDGSLDVAVVAVGSGLAYIEALAALGPRGRLVVFSGISPAEEIAAAPSLNQLHYREQSIVGAYGCSFRHGVAALDLLAGGRLPVVDMISHRLPLADLEEGLRIVKQRDGMKVHLYPTKTPPC